MALERLQSGTLAPSCSRRTKPRTSPRIPGAHMSRPIVIATLPALAFSQAGLSAMQNITAIRNEPASASLSGSRREDLSAAGPDVDLRKSVHAQRLADLGTVIRVVDEETHQHRLARVNLDLAVALSLENILQHRRRPSVQAIVDDRPGRFECRHEFVRPTRMGQVCRCAA